MGMKDDFPQIKDYTTVTIASGASLSGARDLKGVVLCGIQMPAAWDAADLTLQASHDGVTFQNVFDADDAEVTIQAAAARYIALEPAKYAGIQHIKLRSGTSGAAVNQTADRTLTLVLRPV